MHFVKSGHLTMPSLTLFFFFFFFFFWVPGELSTLRQMMKVPSFEACLAARASATASLTGAEAARLQAVSLSPCN